MATQGTVRAIRESLDTTRVARLNMALKYCFLGNEAGRKEAPRESLMKRKKTYRVR